MTDETAPISVTHLLVPALFGGLESVVASLSSGQAGRGVAVRGIGALEETAEPSGGRDNDIGPS